MRISIRQHYEDFGVEGFYTSGIQYSNNHTVYIEKLIRENHQNLPLDNVLDLACGNGLVTKALQNLGYKKIEGIDPYFSGSYTSETGCKCLSWSFKDLVQNTLDTRYSCIICSFALHLCERSMLPALIWRLSELSSKLVVISPSKFPIIGKADIEKFALTADKKRVHYREYTL